MLGVCETWLDERVDDNEIAISDYTIYRKDRCKIKKNRGGGVLLYVHNSLPSCNCMELNDSLTETVWCKFFHQGKNEFYIGVAYRSPNADVEEVQELHSIIKKASKNHVLIIGDFNYPTIA